MNDLHLDVTGDQKMDVMTDGSRGHHRNDLRLGVKNLDVMDDRKMDESHDLRMSDLRLDVKNLDGMTDDRNLNAADGSHDLRMNDLRLDEKNLDVTDDLKMVGSLYHHMSDLLGDRKMVGSRDLRMNDLHSVVRNLDARTDANRGHHRNDLHLDEKNSDVTDDPKMDAMTDASHDHRKNGLHLDAKDERKMDVNLNCHRVIRKCALHVTNY
jgi:hypothetical protein